MPRSTSSLERPNCAMSEGPSAPHNTAASAMNKISSNSWLALSARGSGNRRKTFLNLPMRLPLRVGSRPQNPYRASMQYSAQGHMRFPCPAGEGLPPPKMLPLPHEAVLRQVHAARGVGGGVADAPGALAVARGDRKRALGVLLRDHRAEAHAHVEHREHI